MQLPSDIQIREGLKQWRINHGWQPEQVAERAKNPRGGKFRRKQISKWETGKTGISYKVLVEIILPAYRIDDFDTFIDFCRPPSLEDIKVIQVTDFSKVPIVTGTVAKSIKQSYIENHRTRIDRVIFERGTQNPTVWASHDGHEFVLVLRGSVKCHFAVKENDPKKDFTLTEGMAIVFHSSLYHSFWNAKSDEEAELVAAKPSSSGTADGKKP